jgi:hypothetical protein
VSPGPDVLCCDCSPADVVLETELIGGRQALQLETRAKASEIIAERFEGEQMGAGIKVRTSGVS